MNNPFITIRKYLEAYNDSVKIITPNISGKKREISISQEEHKELDKRTASAIRHHIANEHRLELIHSNRFNQSLNDIKFTNSFKWVGYGDIKDAYYSSNIFLLLIWNFLFNPLLIIKTFVPLVVLYISPLRSTEVFQKTKLLGLRPGLSSTEAIFKLTQFNISKTFNFLGKHILGINYQFQLYVDDFVFYADRMSHIVLLTNIYSFLNNLLLIKIHSLDNKKGLVVSNTHANSTKVLERLGLIIYRNKNGALKTSIRNKTIDKYLKNFKQFICKYPYERRYTFASSTFSRVIGVNSPKTKYGYPLFQTFPPGTIWKNKQQQRRVISRAIRILKKSVPEYRNRSFKCIKNEIVPSPLKIEVNVFSFDDIPF
ncbi:MAG: hypothetical protein CME71_00340 [Halobacteriovorax sp.]|nr:hypothetical protein [Halobacteriovorax sp.]|tara:strand:+ start:45 stop:1154 length:1110 start_codon:yes stop_codon:yes gene_type:complete